MIPLEEIKPVKIEPVIIIILYYLYLCWATIRPQNILMMRKNQKQEQVGEKKGTNNYYV